MNLLPNNHVVEDWLNNQLSGRPAQLTLSNDCELLCDIADSHCSLTLTVSRSICQPHVLARRALRLRLEQPEIYTSIALLRGNNDTLRLVSMNAPSSPSPSLFYQYQQMIELLFG